MKETPSISELTSRLIKFRDDRDWKQFHSLKDLILSLSLEASELLELSQWKPESRFEEEATEPEMKQRLSEECADVFLYLLLITERAGINLTEVAARKIDSNELKYPIEKARGTATKYDKL